MTREEELALIEAATRNPDRYRRITPEMAAEHDEKRALFRSPLFLSQTKPDGTKRRTRPEHARKKRKECSG